MLTEFNDLSNLNLTHAHIQQHTWNLFLKA